MPEVIALTDFVHGRITARTGHPLKLKDHVAADLERIGLVRIKFVPPPQPIVIRNPQGGAIEIYEGTRGKAADDGKGQPSSSLPAAPASPTTTLPPSSNGASTTPNTGASSP